MAINKNHEFEDLEGVKCAIVEKNASLGRVDFLKPLLEHNGYTVVIVNSPSPKAAPVIPVVEGETPPPPPPAPETFTIGVTDVSFNSTNAIFGRMLRTASGHIVTFAYWEQEEKEAHDEVPYYEWKKS